MAEIWVLFLLRGFWTHTFGSGNSLLKKEKTITAAPLISQYHLIIDYRHLAMMLEVSVRSLFYLVFHKVSEYLYSQNI